MAKEKPHYKHDCPCCFFLGSTSQGGKVHDLYVCQPEVRCKPCFVVVRSDNPHDSYGAWEEMIVDHPSQWPSLTEGYERAKMRGLL